MVLTLDCLEMPKVTDYLKVYVAIAKQVFNMIQLFIEVNLLL